MAPVHYIITTLNFTWTTGCLGLCPWSPSLPACSDGKVHSAGHVFAHGDLPYSHAVASLSASQNRSDFHSPLKKEDCNWSMHIMLIKKQLYIMLTHTENWSLHVFEQNFLLFWGLFFMMPVIVNWIQQNQTHPVLIPRGTALLSPSYCLL